MDCIQFRGRLLVGFVGFVFAKLFETEDQKRRVMNQSHSHYFSLSDRKSLANLISMRLDFDIFVFIFFQLLVVPFYL